jgi:predicted GH43/DUF377 family glycosyl hydrolase
MKMKAPEGLSNAERIAWYDVPENTTQYLYGTRGGWKKEEGNPVFGDGHGVCFDVSILKEDGVFKMWFSWRTKVSIAYCESRDGLHWGEPVVVLSPVPGSTWEANELNRPSVIKTGETYKMWYSGQMRPYREDGRSVLGYAESCDGKHWDRVTGKPVVEPDCAWEQQAIMCPHVLFDSREGIYKLWYSAGSNHEPDAIGYATSRDGVHWTKHTANPVLKKAPQNPWEQHKVCACHVLFHQGYYYMFYIGHMHEERASVGIARSRDGIHGWEKHPGNPIIAPDKGTWDGLSVYKPFVLREKDRWMLWYNGARYDEAVWADEKIGLAYLEKPDLWID